MNGEERFVIARGNQQQAPLSLPGEVRERETPSQRPGQACSPEKSELSTKGRLRHAVTLPLVHQ